MRRLRMLGIVLVPVVMLAGLANPALAQEPESLPLAAQGPYGVGVLTMEFVDEDQQGRELYVMIWYPADAGRSSYLMPEYDATPDKSGAPYPLILYSHYMGGNASNTLGAGPHLASYGFVVVSADHNDNPPWPNLIHRPLDILYMLGQFSTLDEGSLTGMMDTNMVGVTGYSSGGTTALMVNGTRVDPVYHVAMCAEEELDDWTCHYWDDIIAYREQYGPVTAGELWPPTADERIRAVVPIAPCYASLYGTRGLATATVPTLLIGNTADTLCDYERDAVFIHEHLGATDNYLLSLIGVDHLQPGEDKNVQAIYNHFTTAFFGYYLQGHEDYADFLTAEYVGQFEDLAWSAVEDQQD
ncbi:MAG: prolyl oligopeptidase family serine peptidase [Anaerolineae bacterium]|nr:prolyl oligopeptidase family serine peptidase [Anaerolineae bacterium]